MISNDIKKIISALFLELAKSERSIDITRQVLSESTDFDAHQIFNYLATNNNSDITSNDIIKFLSKNKIKIDEEQLNLIILFYDINLDGKLSFDEFINLIKSEKSSINNKSLNYSDDINISFNINFSLCKIFEKEIFYSKYIINILKELKHKYGFNIHDIYHSIKSSNFITSETVKNFLIESGEEFLESDINLIMRRLDINKDGKVDFCEFHALLGFPNCKINCLTKKCKTCGSEYCQECYIENHGCHPQKNNFPYNYKYTNEIENKNPNIKFENTLKFENIQNFDSYGLSKKQKPEINKEDSVNIVNLDKLKSNSNLKENGEEIKIFNNFLKFLLDGENKIENIKIELSKNKDFNVEDIFRLFEKNGRGFLDQEDLKYGFGVLNVYPSEFNMKLFMKRYDLQNKGYISYADFYDIIVPFERVIREDIEKRIPKTSCPKVILSREMTNALKKLFNFLIDFENKVNIERKSLKINIKEIFNIFDNNNEGYFYFPNFVTYLTSYGLLDDEKINPDLLYIRLDKNRNGRIDFNEFIDEMEEI